MAYVLGSVDEGGCICLCSTEIHLESFLNWFSPLFFETGAHTLNAHQSLSIPPPPNIPAVHIGISEDSLQGSSDSGHF